jgi:hypothetical protein
VDVGNDNQHLNAFPSSQGEDPTAAPDASRNTGFDDKNMHRYWHYIDQPFSPDGTPLAQPPSINAQERIGLFRHTIASASVPDSLKAYDLVWLLHLIGDVQIIRDQTAPRPLSAR